ncbi:anoctamin-7 isoform X1 [Ciona intestinalis]
MDTLASKFKNFGKNGTEDESRPILADDPEKGEIEIAQSSASISPSEDVFTDEKDQMKECYFRDGIRKIDFVLVYEDDHSEKTEELTSKEKAKRRNKRNQEEQQERWRNKFIRCLKQTGVTIEEDSSISEEKTIHYFKLNCPWHLLTYYAEELNIRAPLQLRQYKSHQWSSIILNKCRIPNGMLLDVPKRPKLYFTCTFRKSKISNFLGNDNHETYFSATERGRIMWEILQTTLFGKKKRAEIGIERLLCDDVFTAAFPLHDGPYRLPKPIEEVEDLEKLNKRQILYEYWARWGRWYKYQPLDHIRDYFGEKIGIYFAWLGFYTAWLLPVAFIGFIVFLAGLIGIDMNPEAKDVCGSGKSYMMCPPCEGCKKWPLSKSCIMMKLAYLFDNNGTVTFAIIMSFWAVFFLEFWKRKSANIAHHWEVMDYEEEEERPRPEYNARAPTLSVNPITGVVEPHFSPKQRLRRMFTGFAILVIMLVVVVIFVLSVILYKCLIGVVMSHSHDKLIHGEVSTIMRSVSGALLNLILIMLMSNVYTAVAEWLTRWEMHRTQTEYENALTFKVFIFQFVNYYSSIFYIAFFKGKFVGYPGHYGRFLGIRNEACGSGGCLIDLALQLFIIMVGKQAINNVQELILPKLFQWWQRRQVKKAFGAEQKSKMTKPWEKEYLKLVHYEGLFEEYLEMVLQFGFITIFVAAFPLAPLFALLNNWIEIRLDASKLVCEMRRPVAERAQNIGVWYEILDALVQIAVITNAFLIAFTSEFIPRILYKYEIGAGSLKGYTNHSLSYAPSSAGLGDCRYKGYRDWEGHHTLYYWKLLACKLAFVITFEHLVFFIGRMIDWSVPDVPESLQYKIKREHYLAKQALADNRDNSMEVMKLYNRRFSQDPHDTEADTRYQRIYNAANKPSKLPFAKTTLDTLQEEENSEKIEPVTANIDEKVINTNLEEKLTDTDTTTDTKTSSVMVTAPSSQNFPTQPLESSEKPASPLRPLPPRLNQSPNTSDDDNSRSNRRQRNLATRRSKVKRDQV